MESNRVERKCRICGTPFVPHHASADRQVTCGPECRRENRRRANVREHLDHIRIAGDLVTCECGESFPREYDRLGRGTSRRLCPACRAVDSRARDMLGHLNLPADIRRCRECSCILGTDYGGAVPADDGRCEPCETWDRKAREKAARAREKAARAREKALATFGGTRATTSLPLWVFSPYAPAEGSSR